MSFKDDAQNKADDLKGRAKEATGAITGDDDTKNEGKADQATASAKQKVSDAADKVKEGVDSVKDKLTGNDGR